MKLWTFDLNTLSFHRHHDHRRPRSSRHHWQRESFLLHIIAIIAIITSLFGEVAGSWLFITQLNINALGAGLVCDNIPGLVGSQRTLCRHNPKAMVSFSQGAKLAIDECQHHFRHQRWNCSTVDKGTSLFGKVMQRGTREAAFVYAISSAGVAHAITRGCSRGKLANCECDLRRRGRDSRGTFQWGGCSDNVKYGSTFARTFIDAKDRRQRDARALMNQHNNRAGRRAVKKFLNLQCKCHGVSGACSLKTCWLAMQPFRLIGAHLKMRYNGATHVRMRQNGAGLTVANRNYKRPTRSDLVYLEDSPDYCIPDPISGSLGTEGRRCNKTSIGTDGCDIMCCGRGFHSRMVNETYQCGCKFYWCCEVKCSTCSRWVEVHTCKGFEEEDDDSNDEKDNNINVSKHLKKYRKWKFDVPR